MYFLTLLIHYCTTLVSSAENKVLCLRLREICLARDVDSGHTYSYYTSILGLNNDITVHIFSSQFEMAVAIGLKPTQD